MAAFETAFDQMSAAHARSHRMVLDRLGMPGDGIREPTGLYEVIHGVKKDVDLMRNDVRWWNRLRDQVTGGVVVLMPAAGLVWWLLGDKITKLFH